jgi:hypothetical protein
MCVSIHTLHVTSLHEVQILRDIEKEIFLRKGNDGDLIVLLSYVLGTESKRACHSDLRSSGILRSV